MTDLRAFSIKEAAKLVGCTPRHLYKLIEAKELAAFPIGKRGLRIRAQEIDRWQNEKERRHTATETSPSATEKVQPLPTTAMKMVSAGGRA